MKRQYLTFVVLLMMGLTNLHVRGSAIFNTDLPYFQQPFGGVVKNVGNDMCRALPKLNNLMRPEGLFYSRKEVTLLHLDTNLNVTQPILHNQVVRWPPILVYKNYEARMRIDFIEEIEEGEVKEDEEDYQELERMPNSNKLVHIS